MQQAYQALRVISEAQTVHIVLAAHPNTMMLTELRVACQALQAQDSAGIKAVILEFAAQANNQDENQAGLSEALEEAKAAIRTIPQPVLSVVRASSSERACSLLAEGDFILIAHEAELCLPTAKEERISGLVAARLGHAAWSAPSAELDQEMERILAMFRAKSALALRNAKASTHLSMAKGAGISAQAEAFQRVSQFYLEKVMTTYDAREGLQAFLEKRSPNWQNR